jgi:pantoate--beta-alanine ligase
MQVVTSIADVRRAIQDARGRKLKVGFVPTMGYLHEGHLALVAASRRLAPFTVLSIFVNPTQFGPNEDFANYPRDEAGDEAKARSAGVDLLFRPGREAMYGASPHITVGAGPLAEQWEGAIRPGHFTGVLTVVAKLFNIVAPDIAIFGQKDFQQATLVRTMVHALDFPLSLVVHPTQREHDGLAMSSRNTYLNPVERLRARCLSRALKAVTAMFAAGETDPAVLERIGAQVIAEEKDVLLDYLAVVSPDDLSRVTSATGGSAVMVAARVGKTRLLDNTILGEPEAWMASVPAAQ